MDDLDTPASPIPDYDSWHQNAGAETPEHYASDEDNAPPQSPPIAHSPQVREFEERGGSAIGSPPEAASPLSPQAREDEAATESHQQSASPQPVRSRDASPNRDGEADRSRSSDAPRRQTTTASDDDDEEVHLSAASKSRKRVIRDDEDDEEEDNEDQTTEKDNQRDSSAAPSVSDDDEDSEAPASKRAKRRILSDDEEEEEEEATSGDKQDQAAPAEEGDEVNKIMEDIFGEDDEDDDEDEAGGESSQHKRKPTLEVSSDDEDARLLRREGYSDEEERPSYRWHFDEVMAQKKAERKKKRGSKRRDGGIDLINDADDKIKILVDQMTRAAALDRQSNENRQPAFQKHKLLPVVRQTLLKNDFFEALLDNGMMSAVSEWLAPLPDKSLPSLEIRTTLLKVLSDYPTLEQGILRQSGLGKAVMYLLKHPRETKDNKQRAARLIREWSRPIFQLDSDYSSMTREERMELDHTQNRRRKSQADESEEPRPSLQQQSSTEEVMNPGHAGFVSRARVPKPSMKAYVNRPKSTIEGQFHGASKNKSSSRFDVAQREFRQRTITKKARRHVGVSIAGSKMPL